MFAQAQRGPAPAPPANPIDQMGAQLAMSPIETVKLGDNLTMLGGPGGNVVVLYGPDGKIVVDSFVQPVWPKLKQALDGMGNAPIKTLIDTHWHFDHTGLYPFIDQGTGGSINGTIAGAIMGLNMADNRTKIVPGHGPLGDKGALTKYRDVLVTVRDRVKKLKTGGKKVEDVLAAKPTAEFDATWGQGFMMPNDFVAIVYNTL